MKWFWISLIGFCVLMCSCASKQVSKSAVATEQISTKLDYVVESFKVDTFSLWYIDKSREYKFIKETLTIKEYDKDTGVITKETKTEREFAQSVQADIEQESHGKVTEVRTDSLENVKNVKIQAESVGNCVKNGGIIPFCEKFGKWIGISIGCVIGLLVVYLLTKYRVN